MKTISKILRNYINLIIHKALKPQSSGHGYDQYKINGIYNQYNICINGELKESRNVIVLNKRRKILEGLIFNDWYNITVFYTIIDETAGYTLDIRSIS